MIPSNINQDPNGNNRFNLYSVEFNNINHSTNPPQTNKFLDPHTPDFFDTFRTPNNNNNFINQPHTLIHPNPPYYPHVEDHHALTNLQPDWVPRSSVIYVDEKHVSNAVLKYIHNVNICIRQISADFEFDHDHCALFLSLQFHMLTPRYIISRFNSLSNHYHGRYLIVYIDSDTDNSSTLATLRQLANQYQWVIFFSWSHEETARYLEALRIFRDTIETGDDMMIKQDHEMSQRDVLVRITQIIKRVRSWFNLVLF